MEGRGEEQGDVPCQAGVHDLDEDLVAVRGLRFRTQIVQHQQILVADLGEEVAPAFKSHGVQLDHDRVHVGEEAVVAPVRQVADDFRGEVAFARPGPAEDGQAGAVLPQFLKVVRVLPGHAGGRRVLPVIVGEVPGAQLFQPEGLIAFFPFYDFLQAALFTHAAHPLSPSPNSRAAFFWAGVVGRKRFRTASFSSSGVNASIPSPGR